MRPFERRKPETFSPEHPIKYHIPFSWGSFSVSESADAVYGLTPLTPDFRSGALATDDQKVKALQPRIDIKLLGPDEGPHMPFVLALGVAEEDSLPIIPVIQFLNSNTTPEGIQIHMGLTGSMDALFQRDLVALQARLGVDEGEAIQTLEEIWELPEEEAKRKLVIHNLIHDDIPTMVENAATSPLIHWRHQKEGKALLGSATGSVASGAAATAGYLAAMKYSGNTFEAIDIGVVVVFGTVATLGVRNQIKKFMRGTETRDYISQYGTMLMINEINNDLHSSFCTNVFDEKAREMFGEGSDDDFDPR
jgi:hypothetical protein